jgi:hypothetical protein
MLLYLKELIFNVMGITENNIFINICNSIFDKMRSHPNQLSTVKGCDV